ncbi:MAG: transposase [Anaerolineae bacterium]|nr:transposase [Anaerolineae bacterium]
MDNMERTDYDSPWKAALEHYFKEFIAFFFPQVYAGIDWTRNHEFLDTELRQVTRDAKIGRRLADKLVKVWRTDGTEYWVLVHIEVQSQPDPDFARRMYTYNYRLFDHYNREVASLAVLGDEQPNWRPQRFGYELWGCKVGIEFPSVKLLDYREPWATLEASRNPFAIIVMAHLKTQETYQDVMARKEWKFGLLRRLYEHGYQRADIQELFEFIDWIMNLPPELELALWQELQSYEEGKKMRYITSVERIGYQRGVQEGMEQGIELGIEQGAVQTAQESIFKILEARFGTSPAPLKATITKLKELPTLKNLLVHAATAATLDEFQRLVN